MKAAIYNWHGWTDETRPDILMAEYRSRLKKAGFNIVDEVHHFFSPYGFTALFLLSESHFAIHTFPEENRTYLELSSCIKKKYEDFLKEGDSHDRED